ncbi:MAG: carboxypeptidase regulatory-like domain-containing protein [Candidatus Saganbacteria bacterium]|nr:carboxypeptidase regulatory-like domain-containing protein [Candidatus Saganbacteria bacterium]
MWKIETRKWKLVGICVLLLGISSLLIGCGQQNSTTSSSATTFTLSGNLGTGTITAAGIKGRVAASGYTIVAIDNETNKTSRATTDSSGNFSISNLTSGKSYTTSLIKNSAYSGPIVFSGSGSEVKTAIKPSADTDLGTITLDTTDGYAKPETAPSSVDTSVTAVADSGVPKGAGNTGKTENSGVTNVTGSDTDKDGIPNVFDADEDNDGKRNGVAVAPSTKLVSTYSSNVESVYMSSNIWADHATTVTAKNLIALRLHVVPQTGKESTISSVVCTGVPASIATVATVRYADSLGSPVSYPTENSLWSASSYGLYKTTTLTPEQWIISIKPNADMIVGEIFTINVNYSDGTNEEFDIVIPYFLTDWARITEYNGASLADTEGLKTNPTTTNVDNTEITFTKPLDESGAILQGLTYSVSVGESTSLGGSYSVPTTSTAVTVTDTTPSAATLTATISTPTDGTTYYITPVAESIDGQRNGAETWCTRN